MSDGLLIFLLAALTALTVAGGALAVMGGRLDGADRRRNRIRKHATARAASGGAGGGRDNASARRKHIETQLKEMDQKTKKKVTIRTMIERAGLTITPIFFFSASAAVGVAAGATLWFLGYPPAIYAGGAIAAGLGLPRWVLSFLAKRRIRSFIAEFANTIDVIVRGVKAGLPLNDTLRIVAEESPQPVRGEFQRVVDGQRVGVTLEQGLDRMIERIPAPELRFFATVLAIQAKTGGNLSEALGNLALVLRDRKRMRGKVQAMSSEAKASAMIIGSLPFLVMLAIFFTSPDYIMLLFQEKFGHFLLMGGATWMLIGILVMRQMINFDI